MATVADWAQFTQQLISQAGNLANYLKIKIILTPVTFTQTIEFPSFIPEKPEPINLVPNLPQPPQIKLGSQKLEIPLSVPVPKISIVPSGGNFSFQLPEVILPSLDFAVRPSVNLVPEIEIIQATEQSPNPPQPAAQDTIVPNSATATVPETQGSKQTRQQSSLDRVDWADQIFEEIQSLKEIEQKQILAHQEMFTQTRSYKPTLSSIGYPLYLDVLANAPKVAELLKKSADEFNKKQGQKTKTPTTPTGASQGGGNDGGEDGSGGNQSQVQPQRSTTQIAIERKKAEQKAQAAENLLRELNKVKSSKPADLEAFGNKYNRETIALGIFNDPKIISDPLRARVLWESLGKDTRKFIQATGLVPTKELIGNNSAIATPQTVEFAKENIKARLSKVQRESQKQVRDLITESRLAVQAEQKNLKPTDNGISLTQINPLIPRRNDQAAQFRGETDRGKTLVEEDFSKTRADATYSETFRINLLQNVLPDLKKQRVAEAQLATVLLRVVDNKIKELEKESTNSPTSITTFVRRAEAQLSELKNKAKDIEEINITQFENQIRKENSSTRNKLLRDTYLSQYNKIKNLQAENQRLITTLLEIEKLRITIKNAPKLENKKDSGSNRR